MTTEAKQPGVFARAEAGSRQWVLQIGLGVTGFIGGSILASGVATRLQERLGTFENEAAAFAFSWLVQRLWIFVLVPAFGWAIGRFTSIPPLRFAVTAGLSGEIFSLLLVAGINGFEFLVDDPKAMLARIVTFFAGLAITLSAVNSGRAAAADAQAEANVLAEQRKAEYAAFLAAAEGRPEKPAETTEEKPAATPEEKSPK